MNFRKFAPYLLVAGSICLSIEVLGLFWFSFYEGGFFYSRTKTTTQKPQEANIFTDDILMHPYFGFVLKPDTLISKNSWKNYYGGTEAEYTRLNPKKLRRNNYGYQQPEDYPLKNEEKDYFIGIFGGSVANAFVLTSGKMLSEALQKSPFFTDKNIRILNFSQPGYKQPQQLLTLTYFFALGQSFDMVINLDGFNEVALSGVNNLLGRHIAMPSMSHLIPLLGRLGLERSDIYDIEDFAKIHRIRHTLSKTKECLRQSHSAGIYFLNSLYENYLTWKHYHLSQKLEGNLAKHDFTKLTSISPSTSKNLEDAMQKITQFWFKNSVLMKDISERNKALYMHFLQPNQYDLPQNHETYPSQAIYSKDSPYREKVTLGYPLLRKTGEELKSNAVLFKDLSELFPTPFDSYYIDNCCHLSPKGNLEMTKSITDYVLKNLPESASLP